MTRTRFVLSWLFPILALHGCGNEENDQDVIELSGTVEAREVQLAFRVGGHIESMAVNEGAAVQEGQVVAELDAQTYRLSLQQARAQAEAARAALAELQAGTRAQEIEVAAARVREAQAQLAFAQSEVNRLEALVARNFVPKEQLDQARTQLKVARAGLNQARENLALAREGPRAEQIERAQAEYEAHLAAVNAARLQLAYTTLTSNADGVITVRVAEPGEVVQPGQPVMHLAELGEPWVRAYLNETDLARVRLGQPVKVTVDGVDKVFPGTLAFISPTAEFTPKTVETRELRVDLVYRIKVNVDNPEGLLKIGMPADVAIPVAVSP